MSEINLVSSNILGYLMSRSDLFVTGILESLYMTLVSTAFAYLIGLPLGILLIITDNPLDTDEGSKKENSKIYLHCFRFYR